VSALLLLAPVPLPDGLSIPAEDWRETPMSVQHQVLSLLKRDSSNSSPAAFNRCPLEKAQNERLRATVEQLKAQVWPVQVDAIVRRLPS
jgi:hypothetical protein